MITFKRLFHGKKQRFVFLIALFFIFVFPLYASDSQQPHNTKPKYIFYFIADGLGYSHISLAEAYLANIEGRIGAVQLNMCKMPVYGMVNTYSKNRQITGSAAAGTALAYGQKENINNLAYFEGNYSDKKSVLRIAQSNNYSTGVISTVSIDHATPAAFFAHSPSRSNYYDISKFLVDSGIDFIGGGGLRFPKGSEKDMQDIFDILRENEYDILSSITRIDNESNKLYIKNPVLLGAGDMPYAIDRSDQGGYSLEEVFDAGLNYLHGREKGFFMVIEGGKIDWAAHRNDAATLVYDIIDFDNAVKKAMEFYYNYPDETLIIVTSDHETGGLSLGIGKQGYNSNFEKLSYQKKSQAYFSSKLSDFLKDYNDFEEIVDFITNEFFKAGFSFTKAEIELLKVAYLHKNDNDLISPELFRELYRGYCPIAFTTNRIINDRAAVGFTTDAHTAAAVPIFSIGVGSELFGGYLNNTDVPLKIIELINR